MKASGKIEMTTVGSLLNLTTATYRTRRNLDRTNTVSSKLSGVIGFLEEEKIAGDVPAMTGGEKRDILSRPYISRSREKFDIVNHVKESQRDMSNGKVQSEGPGIVVLSQVLEILHMNRQAVKLASLLHPMQPDGQPPNNGASVLPPPLTDLAGKILNLLRSRYERSEKGQVEIRANESNAPVHIRGVGVPDIHGVEQVRIVLILTETPNHSLKTSE